MKTKKGEKSEKDHTYIAIGLFTIIIVAALAAFLTAKYYPDILENLFPEEEGEKIIELGDCTDVNYVGKLTDGTVFDSSYSDVDNKTGGTPLNIFVSLDETAQPPEGKEDYSSSLIEGFMEGLIELKEGETATIGPIPPEKGYGIRLSVGHIFNTINLVLGLNISAEVVNITDDSMDLKWIDMEDLDNFTSPQLVIIDFPQLELGNQSAAIEVSPPGYIWENATTITNITNDFVTLKINPTKAQDITDIITPIYVQDDLINPIYYTFPNTTTATWDDSTITLNNSPEVGTNYSYTDPFYGYITVYTIENVTDDKINFSTAPKGQETNESAKIYQEIDRFFTFNRSFSINRHFNNISTVMANYFYGVDIQNAGYSIHELAGKDLLFEVTIEKVYKTS